MHRQGLIVPKDKDANAANKQIDFRRGFFSGDTLNGLVGSQSCRGDVILANESDASLVEPPYTTAHIENCNKVLHI